MKATELKQAVADYQGLRAIWRKDPVKYARFRTGVNPSKQQHQMLEAIAPPGAKVTVRAGHGVGKTTALSIIGWWHLECFDYCKIPCTAPTASQLRLVLWSEFKKTLRRADEQAAKDKLPPFLYLSNLFKVTQDQIYDPTPQSEWFAVARTARRDQPDALQGFHASDLTIGDDDVAVRRSESGGNIMFIIEEASGVPDEIFQVAEGALTSHDARLIMVGNPVRSTGFFARSHLEHRAGYMCLHFSVKDSPLAQTGYRDGLVRKWGENSNVVRVRADGEFPKQDDNVLIPLEHAEAAIERDPPAQHAGRIILGVDVARFGDDRSTYVVRQGREILHIEVHSKEDTMQTTGRAVDIARRFAAVAIHVDVIGIGAGVVDRLKELKLPQTIVGVNVADAATLKPKSLDRRGNFAPSDKFGKQDMYPGSMRDYLWVEMQEWFAVEEPVLTTADCDWIDHAKDLAAEVVSVRYGFDSSGKIKVESKDEMKKRGMRSPDLADGLALTFSPDRLSVWHRL